MCAVSIAEVRAELLRAADNLDRAAGLMSVAAEQVQQTRRNLGRAGDGAARLEPLQISAGLLRAAVLARDAAGETLAIARFVRQVGAQL